jgi:two-component system sensor histidine kinase UhpB
LVGVIQDVTEHRQMQERLRRLTARLETIREDEQRRIAREIHDELGQQLAGLKMRAAWAGHLMDSSAEQSLTDAERITAARAEMAGIGDALESAIRAVRRIATELRPPVLDTLGLIPTLESLRENFERDHGIRCVTHFEEVKVSPLVATAVFRVAQEALTNVAKHARATHLSMSLVQQDASLILDIEDDGAGLPADATPKPDAWGLIGMQERARTLHGSVEFLKSPNGGLTVRLILPCQPVEELRGAVSHR